MCLDDGRHVLYNEEKKGPNIEPWRYTDGKLISEEFETSEVLNHSCLNIIAGYVGIQESSFVMCLSYK